MQLRLDKFLADAGYGTRSEVKQLIRRGEVLVDGKRASGPEQKVDITQNSVTVSGETVFYEPLSYYILNKPEGVLSASRDGREKTVVDLIPEPRRRDLFPVGRLDRDTTGLLLITNDGKLSNRLMAPGKHVPKTYRATVEGTLPENLAELFAAGVDIGDDRPTAPATVVILDGTDDDNIEGSVIPAGDNGDEEADRSSVMSTETASSPANPITHQVELTITEGRYHQVKRMFEAVGCHVTGLERIRIADLTLPQELPRGSVLKITYEELMARLGI